MNPKIDLYLAEGCGRCSLGGTPECKVHNWTHELALLRTIVLDCGLTEELKWGVPCYTFQQRNVLIVAAFKEFCSISFFNGALLQDAEGILSKQGEHSQAGRIVRFTNTQDILALEPVLKTYIYEAIEVEKAGLKVPSQPVSELPMPAELQQKFDEMPAFKAAFSALTPGRQRGYLLHFLDAKQSKTRETRIEKYVPKILSGKGMLD